ncbi:CD109 antigen [Hypsibius exemplaris]|uniref:CD109 antigen n=1 Tax=Hypsibius exemplaris TaxID=2072580 RepID=A0A9X6NDZ8_HYPEX|nr:CD109 antigen [Hypsibius exemplaris]
MHKLYSFVVVVAFTAVGLSIANNIIPIPTSPNPAIDESVLLRCSDIRMVHLVAAMHIRPNADYPVLIRSYRASPLPVSVKITSQPNAASTGVTSTVAYVEQLVQAGAMTMLTLKVPDLNEKTHTYHLVATVGSRPQASAAMTERLTVLRDQSLVLVQFNKPAYKPGETVSYHVVIVNERLLPLGAAVDVTIKDPKGVISQQDSHVPPSIPNRPGFVNGTFSLSLSDMVGEWTLEVKTLDETTVAHNFTVSRYVLPRFLLNVTGPPFLHAKASKLMIAVSARRPYGAVTLDMKADLTCTVTVDNTPLVQVQVNNDTDGASTFIFAVHNFTAKICPRNTHWNRPITITATVSATEIDTQKRINQSLVIPFFCDSFRLHLRGRPFFNPGFPNNVIIDALNQDGSPVTEEELSSASLTVAAKYFSMERGAIEPVMTHHQLLRVTFDKDAHHFNVKLSPKHDDVRIDISLTVSDVQRNISLHGYVATPNHISLERTSNEPVKLGNAAEFKLTSIGECHSMDYVIVSRGTIVHKGTRNHSSNGDAIITIPTSRDMAPLSTLVAYCYSRDCVSLSTTNVAVASLDFRVQDYSRNSVDLSIKLPDKRKFLRPGQNPREEAVLELKTAAAGSLIGILAVDSRLLQLQSHKNGRFNSETINEEIRKLHSWAAGGSNLFEMRNQFAASGLVSVMLWEDGQQRTDQGKFGNALLQASGGHLGNDGVSSLDWTIPSRLRSYRTDFRDAFFFRVIPVGANATRITVSEVVPDSVTTWKLSAFSLHNTDGLTFSNEKELAVFQELFVDLELPFDMIRNETTTFDFLVTHYLRDAEKVQLDITLRYPKTTVATIVGGHHIFRNDSVVRGRIWRVSVPFLAPAVGLLRITATVSIAEGDFTLFSDQIVRDLEVRPEGLKVEGNSVTYPLLPGRSLDIPTNVSGVSNNSIVEGSYGLKWAVYGSSWSPVLQTLLEVGKDFKSLIKLPLGCGEQNMAIFMPNVYVARYLERTGPYKPNPQRQKRLEQNIKEGYESQFLFQLADHSFSSWGRPGSQGSTWLTAFVLRGFSESKKYLQLLKQRDLGPSFKFLESRQAQNGSFIENGFLTQQDNDGYALQDATLTAFVTLAFVEAGKEGPVTEKAERFLLSVLPAAKKSSYTLALVTYALAKLKNYQEATSAARTLISLGVTVDGLTCWSDQPGKCAVTGRIIEATAYVILAFEELGLFNDTVPALKWLNSVKRNLYGGYVSTQDTVVALAAMSKVAERASDGNEQNLRVVSTYNPSGRRQETKLTKAANLIRRPSNIPLDTTSITVQASGSGVAFASVTYHFHEQAQLIKRQSDIPNKFTLTVNLIADPSDVSSMALKISCSYSGLNNDGITGQVWLKAEALTGYQFMDDTDFLQADDSLEVGLIQYGPQYSTVTIPFDKLSRSAKTFELRLNKITVGKAYRTKPRVVEIFEYSEPQNVLQQFYELDHAVTDRRGRIFVLDQENGIHQFTSQLVSQPMHWNKPIFDPTISIRQSTADQQIFLMLASNTSRTSILVCSVGFCGIAVEHETNEDHWSWHRIAPLVRAVDPFGKSISVLAEITGEGEWSRLCLAAESIGDTDSHVLSSRFIRTLSNLSGIVPGPDGTLNVHKSLRSTHPIKPIFLKVTRAKDEARTPAYGYFITIQRNPRSVQPYDFVTRIGRFCADDMSLRTTYIETTLNCQHPSFLYDIATSAAMYEVADGGGYLAVTFGRKTFDGWNVRAPDPDFHNHTALCIYSIRSINELFDKKVQQCFHEGWGNHLDWIVGEHRNCTATRGYGDAAVADSPVYDGHCSRARKDKMLGVVDSDEVLTNFSVESFAQPVLGLQLIPSPTHPHSQKNFAAIFVSDEHLIVKDQVSVPITAAHSKRIPLREYFHGLDLSALRVHYNPDGQLYTMLVAHKIAILPLGCAMQTDERMCAENSMKSLNCTWCNNKSCTSRSDCVTKYDGTRESSPLLGILMVTTCVGTAVVSLLGFICFCRARALKRRIRHTNAEVAPILRTTIVSQSTASFNPPGQIASESATVSVDEASIETENATTLPDTDTAGRFESTGLEEVVQNTGLNLLMPELLKLGRIIGKGNYGVVYEGILLQNIPSGRYEQANQMQRSPTRVAIKRLQTQFPLNEVESQAQIEGVIKEAEVMANLVHTNVMKILGICVQTMDGIVTPLIVLPFLEKGDLHKYVSSLRAPLPQYRVLDFALQIAKGMDYLSNLSGKRIIHRDLAARNCMLDHLMTVKIADFGLARDIQQSGNSYYIAQPGQALPIYWMAPESFERNRFSTQSDVWSYGVVVWEMLTRGQRPYALQRTERGFSLAVLGQFLADGNRLIIPDCCSSDLRNLILLCWSECPERRPTFDRIFVDVLRQRDLEKNDEAGYMIPTTT